jgi:hypothetical protein
MSGVQHDEKEFVMPEKKTREAARKDKREGKSASTQAGEYVHEEIEHVREGKHGARSTKQAIAIGLSKARADGVKVGRATSASGAKKGAKKATKKAASKKSASKKSTTKKATKKSSTRSAAAKKALKREPRKAASKTALSRHAKKAASKRSAASRSASAKKAARTRARNKK